MHFYTCVSTTLLGIINFRQICSAVMHHENGTDIIQKENVFRIKHKTIFYIRKLKKHKMQRAYEALYPINAFMRNVCLIVIIRYTERISNVNNSFCNRVLRYESITVSKLQQWEYYIYYCLRVACTPNITSTLIC